MNKTLEKSDIFQFTAPNEVRVTAVILHTYSYKFIDSFIGVRWCICYAQNKLFTCKITYKRKYFAGQVPKGEVNPVIIDQITEVNTFADQVILPECDKLLKTFNHNNNVQGI